MHEGPEASATSMSAVSTAMSQLKQFCFHWLYTILGEVPSTKSDLRRMYTRAVSETHPDKNKDSVDLMKKLLTERDSSGFIWDLVAEYKSMDTSVVVRDSVDIRKKAVEIRKKAKERRLENDRRENKEQQEREELLSRGPVYLELRRQCFYWLSKCTGYLPSSSSGISRLYSEANLRDQEEDRDSFEEEKKIAHLMWDQLEDLWHTSSGDITMENVKSYAVFVVQSSNPQKYEGFTLLCRNTFSQLYKVSTTVPSSAKDVERLYADVYRKKTYKRMVEKNVWEAFLKEKAIAPLLWRELVRYYSLQTALGNKEMCSYAITKAVQATIDTQKREEKMKKNEVLRKLGHGLQKLCFPVLFSHPTRGQRNPGYIALRDMRLLYSKEISGMKQALTEGIEDYDLRSKFKHNLRLLEAEFKTFEYLFHVLHSHLHNLNDRELESLALEPMSKSDLQILALELKNDADTKKKKLELELFTSCFPCLQAAIFPPSLEIVTEYSGLEKQYKRYFKNLRTGKSADFQMKLADLKLEYNRSEFIFDEWKRCSPRLRRYNLSNLQKEIREATQIKQEDLEQELQKQCFPILYYWVKVYYLERKFTDYAGLVEQYKKLFETHKRYPFVPVHIDDITTEYKKSKHIFDAWERQKHEVTIDNFGSLLCAILEIADIRYTGEDTDSDTSSDTDADNKTRLHKESPKMSRSSPERSSSSVKPTALPRQPKPKKSSATKKGSATKKRDRNIRKRKRDPNYEESEDLPEDSPLPKPPTSKTPLPKHQFQDFTAMHEKTRDAFFLFYKLFLPEDGLYDIPGSKRKIVDLTGEDDCDSESEVDSKSTKTSNTPLYLNLRILAKRVVEVHKLCKECDDDGFYISERMAYDKMIHECTTTFNGTLKKVEGNCYATDKDAKYILRSAFPLVDRIITDKDNGLFIPCSGVPNILRTRMNSLQKRADSYKPYASTILNIPEWEAGMYLKNGLGGGKRLGKAPVERCHMEITGGTRCQTRAVLNELYCARHWKKHVDDKYKFML